MRDSTKTIGSWAILLSVPLTWYTMISSFNEKDELRAKTKYFADANKDGHITDTEWKEVFHEADHKPYWDSKDRVWALSKDELRTYVDKKESQLTAKIQ